MAVKKVMRQQEIDLNTSTAQVVFSVGTAVTGCVQMGGFQTDISTAVVTLYRSNDQRTWHALEGVGVTIGPGEDMSDEFDMTGFMYLAVRVTTVEGSTAKGIVSLVHTEEV